MYFFKQKKAYDKESREWSSDVCSSDLVNVSSLGFSVDVWSVPDSDAVWCVSSPTSPEPRSGCVRATWRLSCGPGGRTAPGADSQPRSGCSVWGSVSAPRTANGSRPPNTRSPSPPRRRTTCNTDVTEHHGRSSLTLNHIRHPLGVFMVHRTFSERTEAFFLMFYKVF